MSTFSILPHIVVDKFGFIYIYVDNRKLYQYDKKGSLITSIDVDDSLLEGIGPIQMINNEVYTATCGYKKGCGHFLLGRVLFNKVLVGPSSEERQNQKPKELGTPLSGRAYTAKSPDPIRTDLRITEKDGATSKLISFPFKGIISIQLFGEDTKGNLFLKTDRNDDNGELVVEIHKLDSIGDYYSTVRMSKSRIFFWSAKNYFISNEGVIYRFLPEEDKVRLEIFSGEGN